MTMAAAGAPETQKGRRGVLGGARSRPRGASGPWGRLGTLDVLFLLPTDTLNASPCITTFQCTSAFQCGPYERRVNRDGFDNALDVLLKALPTAAAGTQRVWLWAGYDTATS